MKELNKTQTTKYKLNNLTLVKIKQNVQRSNFETQKF